jgi:hypothetical protein
MNLLCKDILRKRGFDIKDEDVKQYFSSYMGEWNINTCSKEEICTITDPDVLNQMLFAVDSVDYRMTSTATNYCYDEFVNYDFSTVEASVLDPYIARFVHAINSVGVHTVMSCDGWHKKQETYSKINVMQLWMYERYSVLWLWLIVDYIFGEHWTDRSHSYRSGNWINKWEPDDKPDLFLPGMEMSNTCKMILTIEKGKEKEIHDKIDQYSQYIEKNCEQIRLVRTHMIQKILDERLSEEMDRYSFLSCRRIMSELIGSELEELKVNLYGGI